MWLIEILKSIGDFLRGNIRQLFLILLLLLLLKYLGPKLWILISPWSGWIALGAAVIIIVILLLLYFDGGIKSPGRCSLVVYKYKPDQCVNIACSTPCVSKMGPYPSWMGKWAFGSQATACTCSASAGTGLSGLLAAFEKAKGELAGIGDKEAVRKQIVELLGKELTPEEWDVIRKIMDKIQRGEELTPQDYDELEKILQHP